MATYELSDDLALAQELADRADQISMSKFQALDLKVTTKPDLSPVTEADTQIETLLRRELAARRPDDLILGEEFGGERADGRQWIIDPIDGTVGFVRGVPVWATLIALAQDGVPIVGVASAPALGARWWAATGQGAEMSNRLTGSTRKIQVSGITNLGDATLSFNGLHYWRASGDLDKILALQEAVGRDRAFGDFWSYLLVAEGAIDIATETGLKPYDLAALDIIVREAGGVFGGIDGTFGIWQGTALATNVALHDQVLDLLDID